MFQAMLTTLWSNMHTSTSALPRSRGILPPDEYFLVQALCAADNHRTEHCGRTTKLPNTDHAHAIWACQRSAITRTPPPISFPSASGIISLPLKPMPVHIRASVQAFGLLWTCDPNFLSSCWYPEALSLPGCHHPSVQKSPLMIMTSSPQWR